MTAESRSKDKKRPLVSIVSISYNQAKYIAQALDGFLMQKHDDFDVEIIIADDASTDGTQTIIKRYQDKYGNIHSILRKKNIGIQNNLNDAMKHARGKYIALCEGDDYWTDEHKLQKQVDFLDANKDYALCFHPVKVVHEDKDGADTVFPGTTKGFTLEKLLEENYIQTNSVMYRRQGYGVLPEDILPLDWYYHLYHARFGKIGFINEIMAAYRLHANGVWQRNSSNESDFWAKRGAPHLRMHEMVIELFEGKPEYVHHAEAAAIKTARVIFKAFGAHNDWARAEDLMCKFPKLSARMICEDQAELDKQKQEIDKLNDKLYQQGIDAQNMQSAIEGLQATNKRLRDALNRTLEFRVAQAALWVLRKTKNRR